MSVSAAFTAKIVGWLRTLDAEFLERGAATRLAVLALLSRHHLLLLGPPGTAKTLLAQRVAAMFDGQLFVTLLTKFSTPEDVFGPLSLPALEKGVYERLVSGYLPAADVAFIDEIFKANASILNATLSILNERTFFNGSKPTPVPLLAMLAASNELPEDDEGLEALDDRLLLRICVESLKDAQAFKQLVQRDRAPVAGGSPPAIGLGEVTELHRATTRVRLTDELTLALLTLREACKAAQLTVSDRRWRQAVDVLATCAAIDGDDAVQVAHLGVLRYVLWRRPDQQLRVIEALATTLRTLPISTVTATLRELSDQLQQQRVTLDGLAKRVEEATRYFGYGNDRLEPLRPEATEAMHKATESVAAATELLGRLDSVLAGRHGLWRPFWADVLPRLDLHARVDEVRGHRFLIELGPKHFAAVAP